jgi:hypothetical protein
VRAFQALSEELTSLVDDDGKLRRVSWSEVHALAVEAETIVGRRIKYPSRLEPPRLHQVAWVALAVFSADWLEESAAAANDILRTGFRPNNVTNYFLGCARSLLKRCENVPDFPTKEKLHDFLEDLCFPIKRWVKARLLAGRATAEVESSPAAPPTMGDPRPRQAREADRLSYLRGAREKNLLSPQLQRELAELEGKAER